MESPEHKRNLPCFPSYANLLNIKGTEHYRCCPCCLSMTPRGDWEEHRTSKKHQWKEGEVQEGLSWGSLAKECFRQDWRELTSPNSWWLYEFATVTPGLNLDRSRVLGIHPWSIGLPLSCGQLQLLYPHSQKTEQSAKGPAKPAPFYPIWMQGG